MSLIWKSGLVLLARKTLKPSIPVRYINEWKYGDSTTQGIIMEPKKKKAISPEKGVEENFTEEAEKLEPDKIEREIIKDHEGVYKGLPGFQITLDQQKKLSDFYDVTLEAGLKNLRLGFWKKKKQKNVLDADFMEAMGPDLAVAHFVMGHKGAVKFYEKDLWYTPNKAGWHDVPRAFLPGWRLEAIDLSGSLVTTHGLSHFDNLPYLRYLNVSNCQYVDDYFCDRLTRFRDTLVVLDLSGCPKVTERGISSLHRLRKLRKLCLNDLPHVCEAPMLAIALEDQLPNLEIEGIDYHDMEQTVQTQRIMPRFLEQFEKIAIRHLRRQRRLRPQEEVEIRELPLNPVGVPLLGPGSMEEFDKIMESQSLLEEPPKLLEHKSRISPSKIDKDSVDSEENTDSDTKTTSNNEHRVEKDRVVSR